MAPPKHETSLPFVDPKVTDPRAIAYQAELQRRIARPQVGGGPTPPIPVLDQPAQRGLTIADQGRLSRMPEQGSIFEPSTAAPTSVPLLPGDVLPEDAKQDPSFQGGSLGSMMAVNQPHLAERYGVIRNGKRLMPQQLSTGRGGLSPDTVQGLAAMAGAMRSPQAAPVTQEPGATQQEFDREAAETSAGAAARLNNESRSEDVSPVTEEERKRFYERMDEFDWKTVREALMKDILNNEEQRKIIEERLEPMDVSDLVVYGRISQVVPVIPGKFEPEFQSSKGTEELAIKRLVLAEAKSLSISDEYMLDKYSLMGVALGIKAINKKPLPLHVDAKGVFSEELFIAKFNRVLDLPFQMLASLGVNYFWFVARVRQLFRAEKLKNG